MKTPKEIEEWLKEQEWFPQFEKNVKELNEEGARRILSGEAGYNTISGAFLWDKSQEGEEYWEARDDEFMEWYNQED